MPAERVAEFLRVEAPKAGVTSKPQLILCYFSAKPCDEYTAIKVGNHLDGWSNRTDACGRAAGSRDDATRFEVSGENNPSDDSPLSFHSASEILTTESPLKDWRLPRRSVEALSVAFSVAGVTPLLTSASADYANVALKVNVKLNGVNSTVDLGPAVKGAATVGQLRVLELTETC